MLLEWRAGVQHVVPDALSRLPHAKDTPADVDDFLLDDFTSGAPSDFLGPRGPSLDGVRLAEIDAVGGAGTDSGDPFSELSSAPPVHDANDACLLALRALPFATCVVPDADSITLRRGSQARTPSVRLRPLGDVQLPPMEQLGNSDNKHPGTLTPVEPPPPSPSPSKTLSPPFHTSSSDLSDDLMEVLSAGGEAPRSSEDYQVMETPAIHRAVQVLTYPAALARRQQNDAHLGQVRKSLCDSGTGKGGVDTTSYGLDDDEVVRYTNE